MSGTKKICYVCEPSTANILNAHIVKCIVYEYNVEGDVKYAISVFKKQCRKDLFIKHKQKTIAEKRFKESPQFVKLEEFNVKTADKQIILLIGCK